MKRSREEGEEVAAIARVMTLAERLRLSEDTVVAILCLPASSVQRLARCRDAISFLIALRKEMGRPFEDIALISHAFHDLMGEFR
ncbi:MAG: hypothetical protein QXP81_08650 [Nitrososphaerota archaeon]